MDELLHEIQEHFDYLQKCCLHLGAAKTLTGESIVEVLTTVGDYPISSSDTSRAAMLKFTDGSYGILQDWEDYTGHGCQCSSTLDYYDTLAAAGEAFAKFKEDHSDAR